VVLPPMWLAGTPGKLPQHFLLSHAGDLARKITGT
jgi:hypothetical protein